MATVFIIHGAYGNPKENWIPWLKDGLEKSGHKVFSPQFPTPEGQSLDNWLEVFEEYMGYIDKDTIVVGHSIGVPFLLSVIENLDRPIMSAFFVAGFIELLNNKFDSLNRTFIEKDFDWNKIRKNCKRFVVYHSDNDPYVDLGCAQRLANKIGVDINLVKDAGHFNESAGYTRFGLLFEDIKKAIEK